MDITKTKQWQLDGICEECRRQGYCGHECRRHRLRMEMLARLEAEAAESSDIKNIKEEN